MFRSGFKIPIKTIVLDLDLLIDIGQQIIKKKHFSVFLPAKKKVYYHQVRSGFEFFSRGSDPVNLRPDPKILTHAL